MLEQACSPVSPGDATLTEEIHRLTRVTARGLHLLLLLLRTSSSHTSANSARESATPAGTHQVLARGGTDVHGAGTNGAPRCAGHCAEEEEEEEEKEEEEEEKSLFKADAVNEEDSECDRATQM